MKKKIDATEIMENDIGYWQWRFDLLQDELAETIKRIEKLRQEAVDAKTRAIESRLNGQPPC